MRAMRIAAIAQLLLCGFVVGKDTDPIQKLSLQFSLSSLVVIKCILAECIALWGEPEQAVHGTKERRAAASSGMKGKRVTM